jgi:hypothetical protein
MSARRRRLPSNDFLRRFVELRADLVDEVERELS